MTETENKEVTGSKAATDPTSLPVNFTLRIPWRYHQQLAKAAAVQGCSMNTFVLRALALVHPEATQ